MSWNGDTHLLASQLGETRGGLAQALEKGGAYTGAAVLAPTYRRLHPG